MTFYKSDIPKMAIASVVTAVVFAIFSFTSISSSSPQKDTRISWATAMKFKSDYLNFKPMMVVYDDGSSKRKVDKLEGFKISALAVNEILNDNKNGTNSTKADELMIYFGIEGTTMAEGNEIPNLRIILAGIQDGKIMKNSTATNETDSSVFDRADPCPPNHVIIP